jgi:hypothetical protein
MNKHEQYQKSIKKNKIPVFFERRLGMYYIQYEYGHDNTPLSPILGWWVARNNPMPRADDDPNQDPFTHDMFDWENCHESV